MFSNEISVIAVRHTYICGTMKTLKHGMMLTYSQNYFYKKIEKKNNKTYAHRYWALTGSFDSGLPLMGTELHTSLFLGIK